MHTFITITRLLSILVLTFGLGVGLSFIPKFSHSFAGASPAFAREDEDEEDEEHEEDREDEEEEDDDEDEHRPRATEASPTPAAEPIETIKKEKAPKMKTIVQEIVEERPVVETYVETDPGYDDDSDGDALVDALDPDPAIPQSDYFTDDDGDSVPNALDTRPGADDILALDELSDANANGILDAYEPL